MATEHQQQPHHHHQHHHHQQHQQHHHHQHQSQQHRRHQNNHQQSQQYQQQQSLPGPPHYVDLHVNAGECVSLQLLDGQEQVVAGPTTITMVSQQPAPPVPIPVQVPPGHMIHQIADEKGTLKHIILSVVGADDGSQMESNVINLPQGTFRIDSHGELISTSTSETNTGPLTTLPQQVYFANYNGCPVAWCHCCTSTSNPVGNYQQAPMYSNHHNQHSGYNSHVPITLAPIISSTSPVASMQSLSQKSSISDSGQQAGSMSTNYRVKPESDNYVQRTREQVNYNTLTNKNYSNISSNNSIDNNSYGANNIRHNQHNNVSNKRIMADKSSPLSNHNQSQQTNNRTANVKVISDNSGISQSSNQIQTSQSTGSVSPVTRARTKGGSYNPHHNNNHLHSPHHPANGIRANHHYANSMNHHSANHHQNNSNHQHQQPYHQHQQYEPQNTKENNHHYRNEGSPVTTSSHHHARSRSIKSGGQHTSNNEVDQPNNGTPIASNKHITSNVTNSGSFSSGKGGWQQPGGNKTILNNSRECNSAEAAIKNHLSGDTSSLQQKQPVAVSDVTVIDKQEDELKQPQKKCQSQPITDAVRLSNKILNNNGKQSSTKTNEASGGKGVVEKVKVDSNTKPNRDSSLPSSLGQAKSSGQKKVKEHAKDTKFQKDDKASEQSDSFNGEHLVVSEILSVTLPNNNSKQQQASSASSNTKKTQPPGQRSSQMRSFSDVSNEGHHHESANQLSTSSPSCSYSGHNNNAHHNHHRSNTSSSHNSHGNVNRSVSQPIKFSNLIKQCRSRITSKLEKLVQNSLSSYSDTKFAGLLLTLFTTFAMLLAIFIHIYIVAPVTD